MISEIRSQISILVALLVVIFYVIFFSTVDINLPGNHQGFTPEQPIQFSHRLHSGDLRIECLYCHTAVRQSRSAGIPSASICMNCHQFVTGNWNETRVEQQKAEEEGRDVQPTVSLELEKLYRAVGFNSEGMKYQRDRSGESIEWIRVHRLPDFVYFDHRPHYTAGVSCQSCHGPVETMERVSQERDLSMGWCVNCHRDVNNGILPELSGNFASTECGVCHY